MQRVSSLVAIDSVVHFKTNVSLKIYMKNKKVKPFFSAHVTFTCIESTFSNPQKEFFLPPRTRTHISTGSRPAHAIPATRAG